MSYAISWFSIPVSDFERAVCFYETVLAISLQQQSIDGRRMGIFPGKMDDPVSGAVCDAEEGNPPGPMGTMIYLNGGDDLAIPLARVSAAGGEVLVSKSLIREEIGYYAIFRDSEGNHVGLYSPK